MCGTSIISPLSSGCEDIVIDDGEDGTDDSSDAMADTEQSTTTADAEQSEECSSEVIADAREEAVMNSD